MTSEGTIAQVLAGEARWAIGNAPSQWALGGFPDACLDACVCDPPYELSDSGKASPARIAAKVMLPKDPELKATSSRDCELLALARQIAALGAIREVPRPSASVPIGAVTLDQEPPFGDAEVEYTRPASVLAPHSNTSRDPKSKSPEYLGRFTLELADIEALVHAFHRAGSSFAAGGIGIGFGIRSPGDPRLVSRGDVVHDRDSVIGLLNSALAVGISACPGTEDLSVARFHVSGGTEHDCSAAAALVLLACFELAGAQLIRTRAPAGCLPPMVEPDAIRFVARAADRAQAFDIRIHPMSLADRGFMSRDWDGSKVAYDVATWREVLRVLKPGAHLLAFGGTRTSHRMVCAIEDAGFEVRDSIAWLYASGFPKSLNVSKAIDAADGLADQRAIVSSYKATGTAARRNGAGGISSFGTSAAEPSTSEIDPDARVYQTRGASERSRAWDGWGTALKPAMEPIVLARKPLDGTVAANVLEHGTGGINVDGCRLEGGKRVPGSVSRTDGSIYGSYGMETGSESGHDPTVGRWPANVIHDGSPEVLEAFARYGERPSGASVGDGGRIFGNGGGPTHDGYPGETGTAARFFFCAKASRAERELGCEHLPARTGAEAVGRKEGTAALNCGGRTGAGSGASTVRNIHPTVKPLALMRYLCRLITPPGGVVLDPFAGSGSTGMAALLEGFRFVGLDLDGYHVRIARARITHVDGYGAPPEDETPEAPPRQGSLFA